MILIWFTVAKIWGEFKHEVRQFQKLAIVGEVIATSALKSSEGFTKLAPSAVVIIGYGIAFY
ncbi:SMR family transporter, partial [Klebsiella pneumoniae]|nr:SMR family transporter [Klebsiella pneumoniae]